MARGIYRVYSGTGRLVDARFFGGGDFPRSCGVSAPPDTWKSVHSLRFRFLTRPPLNMGVYPLFQEFFLIRHKSYHIRYRGRLMGLSRQARRKSLSKFSDRPKNKSLLVRTTVDNCSGM